MRNEENQFGSLEFLSKPVGDKITVATEFLDELELDYFIYFGYPIIDEKNQKDYVKGLVITKSKIVILYEYEDEIDSYGSSLLSHLSADKSLFKITANYSKYVKEISIHDFVFEDFSKIADEDEIFSDEDIKKINRAIQVAFNLTSEDDRELSSNNTLGAKLKERNTFIGNYDSTQFNMVHSPITKHQRVRGLAGSGKTILMLKKLAFLHYNYPDLNLAFVFYTTSLKQDVTKKFKEFYKDYDRYGSPDMKKVNIFHSWGGERRRGFYSDLCERFGRTPITYGGAKQQRRYIDPFEYVCADLTSEIQQEDEKGVYDFIFVDEAQDFGINFFKLCLAVLRKPNLAKNKLLTGYLVYAYDELQSLRQETKIPSKREIFIDESLCIDINLKKCYRTPVEILTSAHAIGLGVYRDVDDEEDHPLVNLVDEQTLVDTGYKNLSGTFEEGKEVILERAEVKSNVEIARPVSFDCDNWEDKEYKEVAKQILDLIEFQDVLPQDIMIIDLDESYISHDHGHFLRVFNDEQSSREGLNDKIGINLVNKNNPVRVSIKNSIPYTTIYRAKGNEANLVFILNCNSLSLSSRDSNARNKIFTAMTRAKWQVWLYGKDMNEFSHELSKVKENDYRLIFNYPTEEQRKTIKLLGDKEERVENQLSSATKILNDLPDDVITKLLQQRLGKRVE